MDLLYTLGGAAVLILGAELLLRGAVHLAFRARISPLVVGLTVVSLGTSLPELLVSLVAALKGSPEIAIGNVVGSNIANISLVLGACVVVFPIDVDREARRIHWPVMMAATLLFVLFLADDRVARWEGLFFVVALVAYVSWMIIRSRRQGRRSAEQPLRTTMPVGRALLFLIIGAAGLGFGSGWFVDGASGLARGLGVSERLIGVTIVAVGTSMPELIASLVAAFRKQPDISLGNLVGSNIFNILFIIGTSATITPIEASLDTFRTDLIMMTAIALLLYPMMRFGDRVGRWQGVGLLALYVGYMVLTLVQG